MPSPVSKNSPLLHSLKFYLLASVLLKARKCLYAFDCSCQVVVILPSILTLRKTLHPDMLKHRCV